MIFRHFIFSLLIKWLSTYLRVAQRLQYSGYTNGKETIMGWMLSVSSKGRGQGSTTRLAGQQWRFIQNAERPQQSRDNHVPTWQSQRACRHVLSALVANV